MIVSAIDWYKGLVFILPYNAREVSLITGCILQDDDLVGLWIVAFDTFIAFFKTKVDASLCLPLSLFAFSLPYVNIGSATEHTKQAEIRFGAMWGLIGCGILRV